MGKTNETTTYTNPIGYQISYFGEININVIYFFKNVLNDLKKMKKMECDSETKSGYTESFSKHDLE